MVMRPANLWWYASCRMQTGEGGAVDEVLCRGTGTGRGTGKMHACRHNRGYRGKASWMECPITLHDAQYLSPCTGSWSLAPLCLGYPWLARRNGFPRPYCNSVSNPNDSPYYCRVLLRPLRYLVRQCSKLLQAGILVFPWQENHGKSRKSANAENHGKHGKSRKITETETKVPIVCYCCCTEITGKSRKRK